MSYKKSGFQKQKKRTVLSSEQRLEIKEVFDLFDTEGENKMLAKDLSVSLRTLGFEPRREEIEELNAQLEGSSYIEFSWFEEKITQKILERDPIEEM